MRWALQTYFTTGEAAHFLLGSSGMGQGLSDGRSRMRAPDFSSIEMHKPVLEMQKLQPKVKSQISLQPVDVVASIP